MQAWLITDDEDSLLQGLSADAQIIYMRGMRRYMNYENGVSGENGASLTYQFFKRLIEFVPDAKSTAKQRRAKDISTDYVRARISELERCGLVQKKKTTEKFDHMLFFLPKARVGLSRPNYEPQMNPKEQPQDERQRKSTKNQRLNKNERQDEHNQCSLMNPNISGIRDIEEKELPNGSSKKKTDKGHRLPDGWWPSAETEAWAMVKLAWDEQRISYVTEGFVDYWRSVPGAKGRKTDWDATWRNWARRENEKSPATVAGTKPGFTDRNQRGNYGPERPKSKSDQFDDFIRGVKAGLEAGDDDVRGAVNNLRGSLPWPVDERREQGSCINAVGERIVPIRTGKP
jgi:hypothetical protein